MHHTTLYRLLKRVQREGESGFAGGRHGLPVKLREEVLILFIEHRQATPGSVSSLLQHTIAEHFGFAPSVSQLDCVRAHLELSRPRDAQRV